MDARCLIGLKWGHDEDNLHTRTAWESPLLFLQAFRCKFLAVFDDGGLLDFLIEYQGKQHYQAVPKFGGEYGLRKQKYNDELKRRYCFLHNINLVIIPFWEENILSYEYIMKKAGY